MVRSTRYCVLIAAFFAIVVLFFFARPRPVEVGKARDTYPRRNYVIDAEQEDARRVHNFQGKTWMPAKQDTLGEASVDNRPSKAGKTKRKRSKDHTAIVSKTASSGNIHLVIILKKATGADSRSRKFAKFIQSLLSRTKADLTFHAFVDKASKEVVENAVVQPSSSHVSVVYYDIEDVSKKIGQFVSGMQGLFGGGETNYFYDPLFFLGPLLYRILPKSVSRIIKLDMDLEFRADVADLAAFFEQFRGPQLIGLARENQPVYRHILSEYRKLNPGTRVGEPPPQGLPGFNSGVMLQDLDQIRQSKTYQDMLNSTVAMQLTRKYHFQGHLGDQDLLCLISLEHKELFYVLPCTWNRQLCRYWEAGYKDVFMKYFRCDGDIKVYHGNCNTAIPD